MRTRSLGFGSSITTIGLALALLALPASAGSPPLPSSAEAELMALDQAWIDAEVRGDREALEQILDERCLVTRPWGDTIDRDEFIEIVVGAELEPFSVIHDSIVVHGDTALVIDLSENRRTKFTWIAVKRDGHWRVISETVSKVAEKKS